LLVVDDYLTRLTAGVNVFPGVRESGHHVEHAGMGLPMGIAWLLVSDRASVFCARKKGLTIHTFTTRNRFSPFLIYPSIAMRAHQQNNCE
jgi:hypothetical protein